MTASHKVSVIYKEILSFAQPDSSSLILVLFHYLAVFLQICHIPEGVLWYIAVLLCLSDWVHIDSAIYFLQNDCLIAIR